MYQTFDWTALMNEEDRSDIATDVRYIINQGDYYKNEPKNQTNM